MKEAKRMEELTQKVTELLQKITTNEVLSILILVGEFMLAVIMKKLSKGLERLNSKEDGKMNDISRELNKMNLWMKNRQ